MTEELTGRDLFNATAPAAWAESETNDSWWRFLAALSLIYDPVAEIVRSFDGHERWTQLASPHRCPPEWLPILAQWAGVRRWDAMTEADLRQLLSEGGPAYWRGTRTGMLAAIRRFLPPGLPDRYVYWEERADGDPYKLRVFTFAGMMGEEAEEVEGEIRRAIELAKPAGLWPIIYEVRVGQTYGMLNARVQDYAEVNSTWENYYEVLHAEPPET